MHRDIINQVRELLDRHVDLIEISHKLKLEPELVRVAADVIKEMLT
jgi:hypothetical protein